MRAALPQTRRLGDYTNAAFEILVAAFTVLPFFVLAYFYDALPRSVPLFMSLDGEVAVWTGKSVMSVFRVPLMAVDTQLVCLLVKYGAVKSEPPAAADDSPERADARERHLRLTAGLWDWFRCLVAFKMSAASLDTIFLTVERFRFLSRPAFAVTALAALLSVAGALVYGYRLLALRREKGGAPAGEETLRRVDTRRVYVGVVYFNPSDPAMFVRGYLLNFGNKWTLALIACMVAYPLLVFSPA